MYHLGSWRPQTPINKLMDMVFGIFNSTDNVQGATLVAQMVKNPPVKRMWVQSLGWEDPLEKGLATHSSILAGEFYGQRRLAGYSPWGRKELDMTTSLFLYRGQEMERIWGQHEKASSLAAALTPVPPQGYTPLRRPMLRTGPRKPASEPLSP